MKKRSNRKPVAAADPSTLGILQKMVTDLKEAGDPEAYDLSDRDAIVADLDGFKVKVRRRMSNWEVQLETYVDDVLYMQEMVSSEIVEAWCEIGMLIHEIEDEDRSGTRTRFTKYLKS